ncbi:MAG: hypothetical protein J6I76_11055 [Oribacterium sp.]|nr:hypothetical protein [Oribacterium sp.]
MFKDHHTETVVVVLSVVMGLLMAVAAIIIDGLDMNYGNIFKLWGMITLVILMVSIFIPYKRWSSIVLEKTGIKEGTIIYKAADGIIPTLVLNTIITVLVSAANILYNENIPYDLRMNHWISGMIHDWPLTFVVSYFVSYIAAYIGEIVAVREGDVCNSVADYK